MLHVVLHVALHHRDVERIQPGRHHTQSELTFSRLRDGEVTHRALLSESIDRERLHHFSLSLGGRANSFVKRGSDS